MTVRLPLSGTDPSCAVPAGPMVPTVPTPSKS